MSEQQRRPGQVATMAGQIVAHQRRFELMRAVDRQWVINNPAAALDLFVEAIKARETTLPNAR